MKNSGKSFLKNNYHRIVLAIFALLMLVTHCFVLLGGNDYYHSSAVNGTMSDFWRFHINHYMVGNGRAIIHFFITLFFLKGGVVLWRILNPIVFFAVIVFSAKAFIDKESYKKAIVILSVLNLCLGGRFTSYSTYSLTSSFNYIYPLLLVLILAYCVKNIYENNKKYPALAVLGFFTGATMEQTGMMAIGYIVLIVFFQFLLNKKKPNLNIIITFIATVAGYATVVFAPGNLIRSDNATRPFKENFVAAFTMLINGRSFVLFNLFLIIALAYWLIVLKPKFKIIRFADIALACGLIAGHIVNNLIIYNIFGLTFDNNAVFGFIWRLFDLMYIFAMFYVPVLIAIEKKNYEYLSHSIIALGSIVMLFFASISAWRPLAPAIYIYFIIITLTWLEMIKHELRITKVLSVSAVVLSLIMYCVCLRGYYLNYKVDRQNEKAIAEYIEIGDYSKPLYLLPYADFETSGYGINTPGFVYDENGANGEFTVQNQFALGYKRVHGLPYEVTLIIKE
ncbi:MAG: hypothetical protein IJU45_08085 [Clostridia bacterium]|nr:hypothetical protein [Clostridia bacterium]